MELRLLLSQVASKYELCVEVILSKSLSLCLSLVPLNKILMFGIHVLLYQCLLILNYRQELQFEPGSRILMIGLIAQLVMVCRSTLPKSMLGHTRPSDQPRVIGDQPLQGITSANPANIKVLAQST